jgi:hypothetical protein
MRISRAIDGMTGFHQGCASHRLILGIAADEREEMAGWNA